MRGIVEELDITHEGWLEAMLDWVGKALLASIQEIIECGQSVSLSFSLKDSLHFRDAS
jgi:hypothetical protein